MFNLFKHKCQFCGNAFHTTALRTVIKRTYFDFYNPKGRYHFHDGCLREALESTDHKVIDLALDIVRSIKHEAQRRRRAQEWRQARLSEARAAIPHLEDNLQALYG